MDDSANTFTAMRPQLERVSLRTPFADGSDALASGFATSFTGVVAFMTVVAEGSFAKAGDRLGIDGPPSAAACRSSNPSSACA